MKRRNFIKESGLGVIGLTLSGSLINATNINQVNNKHIILLMSGGIDARDVLFTPNSSFDTLYNVKRKTAVVCNTNIKHSGKSFEHAESALHALSNFPFHHHKSLIITYKESELAAKIKTQNFKTEIEFTSVSNEYMPWSRDAQVFNALLQNLYTSKYNTLILNLEDTDIAHSNIQEYKHVLSFYNKQIELLSNAVLTANATNRITILSALGRNAIYSDEFQNQHHYEEGSENLFCYDLQYAQTYSFTKDERLKYSHQILSGHDALIIV